MYDSSDASLAECETIVSYSNIKQSVKSDVLWLLWEELTFNSIFHLMVHLLISMLNL